MQLFMNSLTTVERQYYLQHAIAPRPIAFASTVDAEGNVNLSPFSFFNLFSSQPPIVIFSPSRRVRNGTNKDTLHNVQQVPEVVINIVTYPIVQQMSLASCEYPTGTNEFVKAGFTPIAATTVKPPLVKESQIQMECKVIEVKPLGTEGGAGNLVICEVLVMHIADELLDENKKIDQRNIQHVARLGGDWYCKVSADNLFQVAKPNTQLGIGVDVLPDAIRSSKILTGNNLGQLANVHEVPVIDATFNDDHLKQIIQYYSISPDEMEKELHLYAQQLLQENKVQEAWQILLATS